jgi:hypothetical protein
MFSWRALAGQALIGHDLPVKARIGRSAACIRFRHHRGIERPLPRRSDAGAAAPAGQQKLDEAAAISRSAGHLADRHGLEASRPACIGRRGGLDSEWIGGHCRRRCGENGSGKRDRAVQGNATRRDAAATRWDAMEDATRDSVRNMGALLVTRANLWRVTVRTGHARMIGRNRHRLANNNWRNSKYIGSPTVHQNVVHIR